MKEDNKKGRMDVALKTPEMGNPFQMMRRFTKDMERLFEDFGGFNFPNFFQTDFAPFRMEFDNPPMDASDQGTSEQRPIQGAGRSTRRHEG